MTPRAQYLARPWVAQYQPGVPASLEIPDRSVSQLFDEATERWAQRVALVFSGREIRFVELREQVDRFAAALHGLGVRHGDRVALYLLNSPQFVIAYFGALKAGAVVTAVSPVYTSHEIRFQLQDSGAKVLVCQDILWDKVERSGARPPHVIVTNVGEYLPPLLRAIGRSFLGRSVFRSLAIPEAAVPADGVLWFQDLLARHPPTPPPVAIDPARDLAALPYTGGTTGSPRGVMLTHRNLVAARTFFTSVLDLKAGQETVLSFLPFFHIYGQVVLMFASITEGHTQVLFTTPDLDAILAAVEDRRATAFWGVPTLYETLKEHEKTARVNWKRLKIIGCGADTLHESTVKAWEARTGTRIREGYGLTECTAASHLNPAHAARPGSFGLPFPGLDALVVDPETLEALPVGEVGELLLCGANVMAGYWQNQEASAAALHVEDGRTWLRTGDLVRMDPDGYFHYVDRRKDLIKVKGYSVFAKHVEEVLYAHPQVKAAGVIGVPDPVAGAIIKAVVVLQPEARGQVTEEEIRAFCKERLAHYKVPRIVEFRSELPKTDVGKVSRRELRDEHGGGAPP
jgi:long-chain acyl-CoA synthetase